MPNSNPAGKNQPLNQHPLPQNGRYGLGEDARIFNNLVADTDYQMVPPPTTGGVREAIIGGQVLVAGAGAADLVNVEARFRDRNGLEARLFLDAVLSADASFVLLGDAPIFLLPEDGGIYFRYESGGGGGEANVAHASWQDTRNVQRQITQLSTTPQSVFPAVPAGLCLATPNFDAVPSNLFPVFNFSDADADVLLELYNGVESVRIAAPETIAAAVTPGALASFGPAYNNPTLSIPNGWELRASVAVDPANGPVELYAYYSLINQGPVRQDQGGAY